ncbi:MAG TPA: DUF6069 family protein [Streptosporangiaceae bacterium]|jgi:hypothetical protein
MAYETGRPEDRPTQRIDPYAAPGGYGRGNPPQQRAAPPRSPDRPHVNGGRLWAGGVATAVIAAGIGVVGLFIARGLFDVPVYLPQHDHTVLNADSVWLGLTGFVAGLVATAVMHALLLVAPRPKMFFGWIVALVTIVAVLWPFSLDMALYSQIATAVISAAMGIAIGSMLSGIASSAVQRPYAQGPYTG